MNTTAPSYETYGLPIRREIAFSNPRGFFKKRIKNRQLKMLKAYAAVLKQFLDPGEEILLAMRGCSPLSFLERLTVGWVIYHLKRCTLVVTNRRILHFPAKADYSPRRSIAQITYGDVDEIKASSLLGRRFTVRYKNGTRETFLYARDTAKLKAVLAGLRTAGQQSSTLGARHHLCPKCAMPLTPLVYSCSFCKMEFKDEKKVRTLSILLPGGGYFYTGHPLLGMGDAAVETGLLIMTALPFYEMATGAGLDASRVPLLLFFGLLLALEKMYTVYHARNYVREYIPREKDFQPMKRADQGRS